MEYFSKVIDLLKASGWQLIMIAAAAVAMLVLDRYEAIPKLSDSLILLAWAAALLCGFLALAPLLAAIQAKVQKRIGDAKAARSKQHALEAAKRKFRDHLPYLSEQDRAVLGYLLKRKQKHFTAEIDAGYAANLLALGFIRQIGAPRQVFDFDKVPMGVPDHVWEVMEEHPEQFQYTPKYSNTRSDVELQPWRVPWGQR